MLAIVTLLGRLGADPDLRVTKAKEAQYVCSFSLAVQPYGQDEPDWWRVTCWDKTAEFASNHLAKGGRVLVIGSPSLGEWDDDKGHHAQLQVTARQLQVIDWAEDEKTEEKAEKAPAREEPGNPRYRGRR